MEPKREFPIDNLTPIDAAANALPREQERLGDQQVARPRKEVNNQKLGNGRENARRREQGKRLKAAKRQEVNRRNASLSKGPKTAGGKEISSKNALKHGLTSRAVLLPDEDEEAFVQFSERFRADLKPVGEVESFWAERCIELAWRLRRAGKAEAAILCWHRCNVLAERVGAKMDRLENPKEGTYESMAQERELLEQQGAPEEEVAVYRHEEYDQLRAELHQHQAEMESDVATLGATLVRDTTNENALQSLSRYETTIERSLRNAGQELQRLQAARKGQQVPLPVTIDVDFSGV